MENYILKNYLKVIIKYKGVFIFEKAIQQFKIGTLNKSEERVGTLTISINDKNMQKEKVK